MLPRPQSLGEWKRWSVSGGERAGAGHQRVWDKSNTRERRESGRRKGSGREPGVPGLRAVHKKLYIALVLENDGEPSTFPLPGRDRFEERKFDGKQALTHKL